MRCFFEGGSEGVLGADEGEADARCMNFMVSSREDIAFGCFPGSAILLLIAGVSMC